MAQVVIRYYLQYQIYIDNISALYLIMYILNRSIIVTVAQ